MIMSDDVDDLLRRAMATLDRQVPPGTFETLAERTLARLDAATLPPDGDELARERALRGIPVVPASEPLVPDAGATPSAARTHRSRRRAAILGAGLGVGVAAVAVMLIWFETGADRAPAPGLGLGQHQGAEAVDGAARPAVAASASPPAAVSPAMTRPASSALGKELGQVSVSGSPAQAQGATSTSGSSPSSPPHGGASEREQAGKAPPSKPGAVLGKTAGKAETGLLEDKPSPPTLAIGSRPAAGAGTQPSSTADLEKRKLGVSKNGTPSLSRDDFQRGMAAVAGQVRACFAGTQGRAELQVTVSPSGRVDRVEVSGVFAGTPVAGCIERAVAPATFPPWSGAPQTLGYSYLLSD